MKQLLIIPIILLLSACATLPSPQGPLNQNLSWQQRKTQLNQITSWDVKGKIGGQAQQQNKTQSFSASVVWEQQVNHYAIYIFGPLGADITQLIGNNNQVTLLTSNKQQFTGPNAEALLKTQLGWSLPVSNLYFWIRGLPAPNSSSHLNFDRYHHLKNLTQQGWNINYLHYTAVNKQYDLPSEIAMQRDNLNLKIIIQQWQLKQAS